MADVPRVRQTVLDTTDARRLAEFYRQLLGYAYRDGDEPPPAGQPDERGQDWLVLRAPEFDYSLAFQQVDKLPATTWPSNDVPQQLHLDLTVESVEQLETQTKRALEFGAELRYDRIDDPEEALRVFADPAGHPFCIFVG